MTCIFIFRRDLRLSDNTALIEAGKKYKIIPIFIYDYHFFTKNHKFFYVQEAGLNDLDSYLQEQGTRLCRFYGKPYKILRYLIKKYKPTAVAYNKDYSLYSLKRDELLRAECEDLEIIACDDITIYPPAEIKARFSNKYGNFVQNVAPLKYTVHKGDIKFIKITDEREATLDYAFLESKIKHINYTPPFEISRKAAIRSLTMPDYKAKQIYLYKINKDEKNKDKKNKDKKNKDEKNKDEKNKGEKNKNGNKIISSSISQPIPQSTSDSSEKEIAEGPRFMEDINEINIKREYFISPHLKLGLISAREVMKFSIKHKLFDLTRNILWREFYFANWLYRRNNYELYDSRLSAIEWRDNKKEAWAMWAGKTGFDIVDAGMRELNETGFMWNRARLFVGFFSIKILRLNPFGPLGGQKYFSEHLIDCCYANNTGNWHWVASDEVDASGMRFGHGFSGRIMNPYKLTAEDKLYIKKWGPTKKYKEIVNYKERVREWFEFTSTKN